MGAAKDIILRPIPAREANALVRRVHYSGKVAPNSQVHIGVFLRGRLEGAMQFGPPMHKRNLLGLVRGSDWGSVLELNRLAFSDVLPRNAESRALGVALRMLRMHAPQVRWLISFADATQCGDGTIYRAAGFILTQIRPNTGLLALPSGETITRMTVTAHRMGETRGAASLGRWAQERGAKCLPGHQLRYIYFLDPSWRSRLTVPELPYSAIAEAGAQMYRGQKPSGGPIEGPAAPPQGRRCEPDLAAPVMVPSNA